MKVLGKARGGPRYGQQAVLTIGLASDVGVSRSTNRHVYASNVCNDLYVAAQPLVRRPGKAACGQGDASNMKEAINGQGIAVPLEAARHEKASQQQFVH
jgi:hypothetical protein